MPHELTQKTFEARMAADGQTLELLMYGPIGEDFWGDGGSIDAKVVAMALAEHKTAKKITLQVWSGGGDVWHGLAIYSALKNHGAKVTARIDGLAASAMTIVLCAADEIEMNEGGLYMIHEARGFTWGSAEEMTAYLEMMNRINSQGAAIYAARSGQPVETVRSMMAAETWMTAQEAKDKGFVTSTKPMKTMSANAAMCAKVPERFKPILAKLQLEDPTMTLPTNPPATPATPAPTPAATPAAPVATAPAATTPATPAVPATPVAQPVTMTAEQATQRASAIMSACVLAGKPEMASKYVDDPAQTAQSVQGALFAMVCAERAPSANSGPAAGDTPPANPNAKFEAEFEASASVYADMGLSKEQYVKSRRVDEGMDTLSMIPAKKAG